MSFSIIENHGLFPVAQSECSDDVQNISNPVEIKVSELSIFYNQNKVLSNVSMEVKRGEITALIGSSGCGKSSFLLALNRLGDLVPGFSAEGSIQIGKSNVLSADLDVVQHRRKVGMIFQKPNPFPFSIRRNIEMPLKEHGVKPKSERQHILQRVLTEVGLWDEVKDRLDTSAEKLSGGQQQRLCIARALALDPHVILFDEPCSALDPLSTSVIEELIQRLRGNYTVIIVTHNLAQARRIADRAAMFWYENKCGRLIEYGTAQQVFENPQDEITAHYVQGLRG